MKYSVLTLLAIVCSIYGNAQDEPYTIQWPESLLEPLESDNTHYYQAVNRVIFNPGITLDSETFVPGIDQGILRTDPQLEFGTVDQNGLFTEQTFNEPINTDYEVGSLPGNLSVNLNGSSGYRIPIGLPLGVNGMAPEIALTYNSNSGQGFLGKGWMIEGISKIHRTARTRYDSPIYGNVQMSTNDIFALDGSTLNPLDGAYNSCEYTTATESYQRIYCHGDYLGDPDYFTLESKNGLTSYYGFDVSSESKRESPGLPYIEWYRDRIVDQHGNYVRYQYEIIEDEIVLKNIEYTGNDAQGLDPICSVTFGYTERGDISRKHMAGVSFSNTVLMNRIDIHISNSLYSSYDLTYGLDGETMLKSVQLFGSDGGSYNPTKFFYGQENVTQVDWTTQDLDNLDIDLKPMDIDGDGHGDFVGFHYTPSWSFNGDGTAWLSGKTHTNFSTFIGDGQGNFTQHGPTALPSGFRLPENNPFDFSPFIANGEGENSRGHRVADFNGDGLQDALFISAENGNVHFLPYVSNGTTLVLDPNEAIALNNAWGYLDSYSYCVGDFDADGRSDLFTLNHEDGNFLWRYHSFHDGFNDLGSGMPWSSDDPESVEEGSPFVPLNLDSDQAMEIALWSNTYEIRSINLTRVSGQIVLSEAMDPITGIGFDERIQFGDFNGDGLADLMTGAEAHFYRSEANGKSFESPLHHDFSEPFWDDYNSEAIYRSLSADVNSDGRSDLIHLRTYDGHENYLDEAIQWPTIDLSSLAAGEEGILEALVSVYAVANELGFWNSISDLTTFEYSASWFDAEITLTHSNLDEPSLASLEVEYEFDPELTDDLMVLILNDVLNDIKQRVTEAYLASDYVQSLPLDHEYDDIVVMKIYVSTGESFYLEQVTQGVFNIDALTEFHITDIDGNSLPELVVVNSSYYGDLNQASMEIIDLGLDSFSKKLTKVKDGLGVVQSVEFSTLADNLVYTKGSGNIYPLVDLQLPISVVSKLSAPNPLGGQNDIFYSYADWDAHIRGLGSLGFRNVTTYDPILDIESTQSTTLHPTLSIPQNSSSVAVFRSTNEQISSSVNSNEVNVVHAIEIGGNTYPRILEVRPTYASTWDYEMQVQEERTWTDYDDFGNPGIVEDVIKDILSNSVVQNEISEFGYTGITGWWSDHLIDNTEISRTRSQTVPMDEETYVRTNTSVYHPNGTLNYTEDDKGVKVSYSGYSPFGQPTLRTVSKSGLNSDIESYSYGDNQRQMVSRTDSYGRTTTTAFHPILGLAVSTTDYLGRTSSVSYTDLGKMTHEEDSFGNVVFHDIAWTDNEPTAPSSNFLEAPDVRYFETVSGLNLPTAIKYFNALGQIRKSEATGHFGGISTSFVHYNERGQVAAQTEPFSAGESNVRIEKSTYDDLYGRLSLSETIDQNGNPLKNSTSYQYAYDPGFAAYRTTVTLSNGTDEWKCQDGSGQVVSAGDPGGTLTYVYQSNGHPKRTLLDGVQQVEMSYDEYGRRESLTDQDAGPAQYRYDAYDRLIGQLDAKGNGYRFNYDSQFNRIESKQVFENASLQSLDNNFSGLTATGQYSYTYESSGPAIGKLLSEQPPSSGGMIFSTSYTYDNIGRVNSLTETIDSQSYTSSLQYDDLGRASGVTLASGAQVTYGYNPVTGMLESKTADDGTLLWQASAQDARGKYTDFSRGLLGGTMSFDDLGFPTHIQTTGIQNLELSWDENNGNLLYRSESGIGMTQYEHFNYDGLNRLTQSEITSDANPLDWSSEECKVTFATSCNAMAGSNGNILAKFDAGSYTYAAQHPSGTSIPHAVSMVTDPQGLTSEHIQTFLYTAFNSVSSITEDIKSYELHYGADDQRRLTIYKENDVEQYRRIYAGSYERQELSDGTIWEVQYIQAPTGLAAMYVKENGANGAWYFPLVDQLGSILGVYDSQGNLVSESLMNFDAWGRYRDSGDWIIYSTTSPMLDGTGLPWLWRGYTGHEQIDAFGVINMNGRCYDPLLGRMLSPDNYVQSPYNSQDFNRYSYVLNNPLKYIDPNGEIPIVIPIVAAVVGAYIGGSAANGGDLNLGNWDWQSGDTWAGIGIGAVLGFATGYGAALAGPGLAGTGFFSGFANGTVVAYGLTGTLAGGALGYASGLAGGLLYSNGDWGYAHMSAVNSSVVGAAIGGVVGSIAGLVSQWRPKPLPELSKQPALNYERPSSSVNLPNGGKAELSQFIESSELYYDGEDIYWVHNYQNNTSALSAYSWSAESGPHGNGALPNGIWNTGEIVSPSWNDRMIVGEADFAIPLFATFNLNGRSGFYIHPDTGMDGTLGCVGLNCAVPGMLQYQSMYETYWGRFGSMMFTVGIY